MRAAVDTTIGIIVTVIIVVPGLVNVVLAGVIVLEAQVEVELMFAPVQHVVEPPVEHGLVPHYGKMRHCHASFLYHAPSHGKASFAVRRKGDARQRNRRMANYLALHGKEIWMAKKN